jgi:hypothetical protein
MKSLIAVALTLSCVGLVALTNPACSSSSTPVTGTDSGSGSADTGSGGNKDTGSGSTDTGSGTTDAVSDSPATGDDGGGGCTDPGDAAGLLGPPACQTCLETKCPGGDNLVAQCACDPGCVKALQCLDACVADGGATEGCAVGCLSAAMGDAQTIGGSLLACVGTSSSPGACNTACSTAPTDGGGADTGTDAK